MIYPTLPGDDAIIAGKPQNPLQFGGDTMHCLSFWVYKLENANRRLRYYLTPHPNLDATYWQQQGGGQVHVLSPSLPLARAEALCNDLQGASGNLRQETQLLARAWQSLGQAGVLADEPVEPIANWEGQAEAVHLHRLLAGRILLLTEVEQAVVASRLFLSYPLPELLHYLYLEGKLQCRPAVALQPKRRCLRCGSYDLQPTSCLECGSTQAWSCQNCGAMGQAKSCTPLYACAATALAEPRTVTLNLPSSLTAPQIRAARLLQQFLRQERQTTCLFWAVCGAGKTEATLPTVQQVLTAGGRVLWASPRRDLVTELAPRLQAALPGLEVAALHGQVRERFTDASLVIATTHQALRLFSAFDLVILDEVDAFPYADNPMLELAVLRALRPGGKLIYLTATPTAQLLQQVQRGQVQQVLLPVRWHGRPLPEPSIRLLRLPRSDQSNWAVPNLLAQLLTDSLERDLCQVLLYVPSVHLAEQVGRGLQAHFGRQDLPDWVEYIHAADAQRDVKRGRFFAGEFPILVTTTLLERGITLPRVNIFVLYADRSQIFSEPVLTQIAGRAGRAAEYPTGQVYFLAERRSREMVAACKQIQTLNKAAQQIAAAAFKEEKQHVES